MEIINDMKLRVITDSAYVRSPFNQGLKALEAQAYRLISSEENAGLRIQKGKDEFVSTDGNWVGEGVLYVPNKGRYITRHSAVLDNPKKATQAHKDGKAYFVSREQVERALEGSIQVPYDVSGILTNRFEEEEITSFCFGKLAKDYGLFLKDAGIEDMSLWFNTEDDVNKKRKPFANQLRFLGLDYGSGLLGTGDLYRGSRSRGIK